MHCKTVQAREILEDVVERAMNQVFVGPEPTQYEHRLSSYRTFYVTCSSFVQKVYAFVQYMIFKYGSSANYN